MLSKPSQALEPAYIMEVIDFGIVGAGRVIKFPVPLEREWITVPDGAKKSDIICTFTVFGDSLTDIGIFHGDKIACRRNFEMSEITPTKVCIISRSNGDELSAKRLKIHNDGTITIISATGTETVFADTIRIQALAFEHKRKI